MSVELLITATTQGGHTLETVSVVGYSSHDCNVNRQNTMDALKKRHPDCYLFANWDHQSAKEVTIKNDFFARRRAA